MIASIAAEDAASIHGEFRRPRLASYMHTPCVMLARRLSSPRRRALGALVPLLSATLAVACSTAPDAASDGAEIAAASPSAAPTGNGPEDDPCAFGDPAVAPWRPAEARGLAVGEFEITLRDLAQGGALGVTHARFPGRDLFSSRAGRLVHAAQAKLDVHEHQGSFSIEDHDRVACEAPRVTEIASEGHKVRLRGRFADAKKECDSLTFTVGFCQARPGHLAFEVKTSDPRFDAITFEAASDRDEKVFGLGEQFPHDKLDLKGRRIPVLAQEGGVGRGHVPISPAVNAASKGSAGSQESTYYAAPHVLTSRLRSFFLANTELVTFDMTAPDAIRVRTNAPIVRGRILAGASPLELLERFTEYTGRMPPLPKWVGQGAIVAMARELDEGLALVEKMKRGGVEISAVWNQTWPGKAKTYIGEQVLWNWAYNPQAHPGWSRYVERLDAQGIKTLCYVNSMFRPVPEGVRVSRDTFTEGLGRDAFVKGPDAKPLMLPVTAFDVALLDVSKPDARAWMKEVIKTEMIDKARCSGWMADFAEALPFEAKMASGETGASYHNQYPVEWMRLNREVLEENGLVGKVLVWNRSGHTKTPGVSTLLWEGDQLTTWDKYDGLVSALHGLINGGLSGIALNHSDTGGYTSLSAGGVGYDREVELLERWAEMSAFTAVLRTHEGNQPQHNAQVYDDARIAQFARMSKVYKALAPYRETLFAEAHQKGWPVVRHLLLEHPNDPESWSIDDEFMLGSELLVAPVKNKCFTWPLCPYDKEVYLPPGRWVHLWTGKVFGDAARGARVKVKAPIGQPAVFYREGSRAGADLVTRLRAASVM